MVVGVHLRRVEAEENGGFVGFCHRHHVFCDGSVGSIFFSDYFPQKKKIYKAVTKEAKYLFNIYILQINQ